MIHVELTVDIQAAAEVRPLIEKPIEAGLDAAMDRLLEFIEQAQILAYTGDANPPRPGGSVYIRTFTLQGSSRKERPGRTLANMSGLWYADAGEADYADEVIGAEADQADIHRGRWKSLEDVEAELLDAAPQIIEDTLEKFL